MKRIKTTTGKRIGLLAIDLSAGEVSPIFALLVTPGAAVVHSYKLTASADADVTIYARPTSGGAWVAINATPIDLLAYMPEVAVSFDFKAVAAATLVDVRRVVMQLQVTNEI